MIRFVTQRNFPLVDLQIEQAYRRRRICRDIDFLSELEDRQAFESFAGARSRGRHSREWLRRLAKAVDALTKVPDGPTETFCAARYRKRHCRRGRQTKTARQAPVIEDDARDKRASFRNPALVCLNSHRQ